MSPDTFQVNPDTVLRAAGVLCTIIAAVWFLAWFMSGKFADLTSKMADIDKHLAVTDERMGMLWDVVMPAAREGWVNHMRAKKDSGTHDIRGNQQ